MSFVGAAEHFYLQIPWLLNASFRDNVLFGNPMDETWYKEVLIACALVQDLELFPAGDLTEIGEKVEKAMNTKKLVLTFTGGYKP